MGRVCFMMAITGTHVLFPAFFYCYHSHSVYCTACSPAYTWLWILRLLLAPTACSSPCPAVLCNICISVSQSRKIKMFNYNFTKIFFNGCWLCWNLICPHVIHFLLRFLSSSSKCCFFIPRLCQQYSSVFMPQGTCVCVRPGRRQKMTPDLYLSAFKSSVLWLNTTTEQFACCKAPRLNRWFSAPCQVILPWQHWLQCYQHFIFLVLLLFLILTFERKHILIFL